MKQKIFDLINSAHFRRLDSIVQDSGTLQMKGRWPKELRNCGIGQRDQHHNTTIGYEIFSHSGSEMVYRLVSYDLKSQRTDTDHAIVNLVSEKGTVYYQGVGTNSHIFGDDGHTANRDYLRAGTNVSLN